MAGRRNQSEPITASIDSSTMVYVSMAGVVAILALSLYTFGIDFGFIHFGGTPNVNILYGGAAVCVALSYIVDILYIKTIRRYYRAKPSFMDYVPYVNFLPVLHKNVRVVMYFILGAGVVVLIPAMTPLGQFMPVDYLLVMSKNSMVFVIAVMGIFSVFRGYQIMKFKRQIEGTYKREVSENYGSGGGFTLVSHAIYYLPIIRAIAMFTDINFINTVKSELDDMQRGEE